MARTKKTARHEIKPYRTLRSREKLTQRIVRDRDANVLDIELILMDGAVRIESNRERLAETSPSCSLRLANNPGRELWIDERNAHGFFMLINCINHYKLMYDSFEDVMTVCIMSKVYYVPFLLQASSSHLMMLMAADPTYMTAIAVLGMASSHGCQECFDYARDKVKDMPQYTAHEGWAELTYKDQRLVHQDLIGRWRDIDLVELIIDWVSADLPSRLGHFEDMMLAHVDGSYTSKDIDVLTSKCAERNLFGTIIGSSSAFLRIQQKGSTVVPNRKRKADTEAEVIYILD